MKKLTLEVETTAAIMEELRNVPEKYRKPFNSAHEGYVVIKEEVDELWDEVKFGEKRAKEKFSGQPNRDDLAELYHKASLRAEAIQAAAMCVRFIQELT